jgi:hypothetical protein
MRQRLPCLLISIVCTLVLTTPGPAPGQETVQQNPYPETVEVEGTTLQLIGAGLRQVRRFFIHFDVYTMGAYSESGACDAAALIAADEIKYLRIDTLRDLSSETIRSGLGAALEDNTLPNTSADLRGQSETFLTYFDQDLDAPASMELVYVPGAGTTVTQNGEAEGAVIPGKAFADVLWSSYFSDETCCTDLRNAILRSCSNTRNSAIR